MATALGLAATLDLAAALGLAATLDLATALGLAADFALVVDAFLAGLAALGIVVAPLLKRALYAKRPL